jgi:hypothetical protein
VGVLGKFWYPADMNRKRKMLLLVPVLPVLIAAGATAHRAYWLIHDFEEPGLWDAVRHGLSGDNQYHIADNGPIPGLDLLFGILIFPFIPVIAAILGLPMERWLPWEIISAPIVVPLYIIAIIFCARKPSLRKRKLLWFCLALVWLIYSCFCYVGIMEMMSA